MRVFGEGRPAEHGPLRKSGHQFQLANFNWEESMHAVLRSYSGKGARELFDVIEKNKTDVEKVLRSVKGFVAYSLARTSDGGFSMTVCQDRAGADESSAKAKDWIKQ